jgi:4-amino-4-deoxy-L-arabinose transferase-like glycosyltransferase
VARSDRDGPPSVTHPHPDTSVSSDRAVQPALLAIATLFAFIILVQGISAPFQKDAEPQSAEWIQSIVHDGHWLIPADAYGYTDRKPPLFYWLSAIVAKATGGTVDEVRARAVSVVAGTALAVGVLAWTVANVGASEGWLAFLFMLGTYGFASRATEALTDMLLTFLLFAAYSAIYPLLDAPTAASPDFTRRKIFVGAILGLGILAKGPIAIVLCALAASIYLLIERRNPIALLRQRWPWQVVAIAVAIGAIWYVPAAIVGGHKIVRIIFAENFGHFMPARFGGTGESYRPFYYIAARLLGGAFPMTLLILPAALAFYTGEISQEKRRPVIYQISMSLAVLLFFSIASVKRDDYILPALPGIAILCASVFTLSARGAASKLRDVIVWIFLLVPTIVFVFLVFFPGFALHLNLQSSDSAYYAAFREIFQKNPLGTLLAWMSLVGFAALSKFIFQWPTIELGVTFEVGGITFGVLALFGSLCWTAALRPYIATLRSVKTLFPIVADYVHGHQLCIPSGINYELSYYYGIAAPDLANPQCANVVAGQPVYLLATSRELEAMTPQYRARLKFLAKCNLIDGGGTLSLFEISPEAAK